MFYENIVANIVEIVEISEQYIDDLKKSLDNNKETFLLMYYVTGINYCKDICLLLENKRTISLALIIRSIFELSVNIQWFDKDNSNFDSIYFEAVNQSLKMYREVYNRVGSDQIKEVVDHFVNEKKKLDDKKVQKVPIYKKCDELGIKSDYELIYSFLCSGSHKNLDSLYKHYVAKVDDNIIYFCEQNENASKYINMNLVIMVKYYIDLFTTILKIKNIDYLSNQEKINEIFTNICKI